jgi:hypothetical protein
VLVELLDGVEVDGPLVRVALGDRVAGGLGLQRAARAGRLAEALDAGLTLADEVVAVDRLAGKESPEEVRDPLAEADDVVAEPDASQGRPV